MTNLQSEFNGTVDFTGTIFNDDTSFGFFNDDTYFKETIFNDDVRFFSFDGDAHFEKARFKGIAVFDFSVFSNDAYFRNSDFNHASFNFTKFEKVYFSNSKFNRLYLYETDFEELSVSWSSIKDALVYNGRTYIKLIKNFKNREQFKDTDDAYYQYRFQYQANKRISMSNFFDLLALVTCGYGVKPSYTFINIVLTIFIFAVLYWKGNGISRVKGAGDRDNKKVTFWDALYFSMVTFTTSGYGDWYPRDNYRKFVIIEGLLGWMLLALFLITLAKVMIRI